jgi:hypothetical protein
MALKGSKWAAVKKCWFRVNPPGLSGFYTCTFCELPIIAVVSLDHILKVADFPELQFVLSNLQPMHPKCNSKRDRLMTDPKYVKRCLNGKQTDAKSRARVQRVIDQAADAYRHHRVTTAASTCPEASNDVARTLHHPSNKERKKQS